MSYAENNWERKIKFPGWKMYLNSFQAYVARQNLKKLPEKLMRLNEIKQIYNEAFNLSNTSDHLYRIKVGDNNSALRSMKEKQIICGIHYEASHLNKVYNNKNSFNCPESEVVAKTMLSIPFNEKLTSTDIKKIIEGNNFSWRDWFSLISIDKGYYQTINTSL